MTEHWVSADVIAEHLGVTKDSIYVWIANREMPAHRVGRLWKFQITEVDAWVRGAGAPDAADEKLD
ncbi:excisionase family DNA-binding protein [Terrabacter tumescens]|uniref:excisionase family DNA-binding protein n=1 Tax=Terrabacter tumescens TaxID=60443 RepID=UPI0004C1F619|nr:excisionase family DNA-binding protein [Terrabacter tumescens]